MKKFKIKNKLLPFLTSGIILLTGCGTVEEFNVGKEENNDIAISEETITETEEEQITTTTNETKDKTTTNETKDKATTTTTTTTEEEKNYEIAIPLENEQQQIPTSTETYTTAETTEKEQEQDKPIKHPGESGFNEFNNHLTDIIGEYNTYSYIDCEEEYIVSAGEQLKNIAKKLNTTEEDLIERNSLTTNVLSEGQVLKYRVKDEFINLKAGTNVSEIATVEGIDLNEILTLNDIPEYNTTIGRDAAIKLHRYIGNETSYETKTHKVNVIYNNRISGDKIVFATGFAGASQKVFVLDNSRFVGGTNTVTEYTFDGGTGCASSKIIMTNAKDIETVGGLPVAYFRTEEDLQKLADQANVELDMIGRMQWETTNIDNYTVYMDELGNKFIVYSDFIFDNNVNTQENNKVLEKK